MKNRQTYLYGLKGFVFVFAFLNSFWGGISILLLSIEDILRTVFKTMMEMLYSPP